MRARIVPFIALIEHMMGRHGEATALLERTLADLPDQSGPEAAGLMVELANDAVFAARLRPDAALGPLGPRDRRAAGRPRPAGRRRRDLRGRASTTSARSSARWSCSTRRPSCSTRIADDELAGRLDAALIMGWCSMNVERFDDGERQFERGTAVARATGQGHLLAPLAIGRAICCAWRGELARAAELAEDAIDARAHRAQRPVAHLVADAARLDRHARRRPRPRAARSATRRCALADEAIGENQFSIVSRCYVAETRLEAGAPERCRAEMVAGAGGPDLPWIERAYRSHMYDILARAELALGDAGRGRRAGRPARPTPSRARRSAGGSPRRAGPPRPPRSRPGTSRRAVACGAGRRRRAAADAGLRIEAARSHTLAGHALRRERASASARWSCSTPPSSSSRRAARGGSATRRWPSCARSGAPPRPRRTPTRR